MYNEKLTSKEIFMSLIEINEGELLKFGGKNLKKMAYEMWKDKNHPSWGFITS